MNNEFDVLIAGSGVAGLYAALNFAPDVRVLVLSKRERTLCNSFLAQGGVAAVVDREHDDYRLHIADTLIAGGYKNDLRSLEILVNEGPEDVLRLLKEMGVDFDRDESAHLSMTLEGGHSRRRILHHKDSTGREITEKLLANVESRPNITICDNTYLAALTPSPGGFWAGLLADGALRMVSCSYCIHAHERFMERYDSRLELAPRDVVSRSIMKEAARTGSEDFYLDIRFRGEAFIKDRFPMIYARCLEEGVDITQELIPVFPCQHYLMGGIDVSVYGDTTVDRLYAAGECSHTGVHGLNRLASNSLLEALVFARRTTYDISRRMRHEESGVAAPAPAIATAGRPLPHGYRTEIRSIMQKAWFVIPDFVAVETGLRRAEEILADLQNGGYALTPDFIEAKSLATVCSIILREVSERNNSAFEKDEI